jgi:ketosteroid isomerase-like protein
VTAADVLHRYAAAIDRGAYDELREVFTEDATFDFGSFGSVVHGVDGIVESIRGALSRFETVQHFISNVTVGSDGAVSSYFLAYHLRDGKPPWTVGGEYRDHFVGGKIAHRTLEPRWQR